ncbi:hypothetical protein C1H46_019388 [Malus baccata]|uniref:Pentatricopeptide repeat-containing protein n=1 Tax=Malus baccata TaxID=106549 RepID=A0A540M882_MALBA|nr:hypothetical protein C1H46_019388 [Malus baccata]
MLQVFDWRRRQVSSSTSISAEEYAEAIIIAGKAKNVELSLQLFTEAINKRMKTTSIYNALMSAYMFNGHTAKCQSLFRDLKKEPDCHPTIVTYNILISVFGRLMLVDHMEATVRGLKDLGLSPNLSTYNRLIAGYITAWMWNSMEQTFEKMKEGPVSPDISTHLLMLRGYAHSGNLVKMEETYELVKHHIDSKEIPLIRAMICAYCKSSVTDRVEKIHKLMKLIPENEYRPRLNVTLIRVMLKRVALRRWRSRDVLEAVVYVPPPVGNLLLSCRSIASGPFFRHLWEAGSVITYTLPNSSNLLNLHLTEFRFEFKIESGQEEGAAGDKSENWSDEIDQFSVSHFLCNYRITTSSHARLQALSLASARKSCKRPSLNQQLQPMRRKPFASSMYFSCCTLTSTAVMECLGLFRFVCSSDGDCCRGEGKENMGDCCNIM